MSRLEDKFRERLLGHLSDANTEVDVRVAVEVCKNFTVSFISFLRENYTDRERYENIQLENNMFREYGGILEFSLEEILEIYLNEE